MGENGVKQLSEDELMNLGSQLMWNLRKYQDVFLTNPDVYDEMSSQLETLVHQSGHLGDKVNECKEKISELEAHIEEAHRDNESMQAEMRCVREERDETLQEMESNWEEEVLRIQTLMTAAVGEKAELSARLSATKADLEHLTSEKKEVENTLEALAAALSERDRIVVALRERLSEGESTEGDADDEEGSVVRHSSKERNRGRALKVVEDKYRMLASRYENLMEKQSKQENMVDGLRTANQELRTKLTMTSLELSSRTDDTSPHRPSLTRSLSLKDELAEINTTFNRTFNTSGTSADVWNMSTAPNSSMNDSLYVECDSGGGDFEEEKTSGTPVDDGTSFKIINGSHKQKGWSWSWSDILFWSALYIFLDVLCFQFFGVHIFYFNKSHRQIAIF